LTEEWMVEGSSPSPQGSTAPRKVLPLQNQLPVYALVVLAVRADADEDEDVNTARAEAPDVDAMAPVAAGLVGATVPETVVSLTKGLAVSVV